MALPVVDGTTALTSANLHKFLYADDDGTYALTIHHIWYDGTSWNVGSTSQGMTGSSADLSLTWNATDNRLDVDLTNLKWNGSNFSQTPAAIAVEIASNTGATFNYIPRARATSTTACFVRFYNASGTEQTTQSTLMDFFLVLCGKIA